MKKFTIFASVLVAFLIQSCGGQRQMVNGGYYNNPYPQQQQQPQAQVQEEPVVKSKKREVSEVDRLAAEETDKLRAVGVATDYDEQDARTEALQNGQREIASFIETAVIALTKEYNKKTQLNNKTMDESDRDDFVEFAVAQNVSVRPIGIPEIYDLSDGSVRVARCVELREKTENILGKIHDSLTQEEIIGVDYDKQKFINDNIDRINELRDNLKK